MSPHVPRGLTRIKCGLMFLAVLFLVLSFPMQVYAGSPYPALLPYPLVTLAVVLDLYCPRAADLAPRSRASSAIRLMVVLYVLLVLLNTGWQTMLEAISLGEGISALAVYVLPVIFYVYFRRSASLHEIRAMFFAMVVAGVVVGTYYLYDTYVKMALGTLSDYSLAAFQYSLERSGQSMDEANRARISLSYRSYGLLQAPSVSAAWVILGGFAALALTPFRNRVSKQAIIVLTGATLLLALNFTSIFAFVVTVLFFEFAGVELKVGRQMPNLGRLASIGFFVALLVGVVLWFAPEAMLDSMLQNLYYARDLAFTTGDEGTNMTGLVLENAKLYLGHVAEYPLTFIFGDGFSSFGLPKGGDIGFIETLAKFGFPYFAAVLFGYIVLIGRGMQDIRSLSADRYDVAKLERARFIRFAACVSLLVLLEEGHYTIWVAKSILPIVFFALALFERYLCSHAERRTARGGQADARTNFLISA